MSPRGKQLNEHMRAEAKERITRAALEVFAECGYFGAKMSQIMEKSGLSKGLMYHYFPSKEKLFFHLVESALNISKRIWMNALDAPGTAWEKIENLSATLVENAFTEESSLYFLIMVQALTQGSSVPGLMEYILQNSSHYNELLPLIIEAQESGEAAAGDPGLLSATYFAVFQGFTLVLPFDPEMRSKITPEIFTNVLRNTGQGQKT